MEWFQLIARMLAPSAQHPIGSSGDIYPTVTVYLDESLIIPETKWFESFSLVAAAVNCVEKPL
jgi:hypothetical protein